MKKLVIVGASGHGKVVADAAECAGWSVTFLDDGKAPGAFGRDWVIQGSTQDLIDGLLKYDGVIVGIGDNVTRLAKTRHLIDIGCDVVTIIHPGAIVSQYSSIGAGSIILAGSVVNVDCSIGMAGIINTGSTIDHDCRLADGVHICPGANLAGDVSIGEGSWIGIGSCIKEQVAVGCNVVVGAGSTVIRGVPDNQVVMGTPARPFEKSV